MSSVVAALFPKRSQRKAAASADQPAAQRKAAASADQPAAQGRPGRPSGAARGGDAADAGRGAAGDVSDFRVVSRTALAIRYTVKVVPGFDSGALRFAASEESGEGVAVAACSAAARRAGVAEGDVLASAVGASPLTLWRTTGADAVPAAARAVWCRGAAQLRVQWGLLSHPPAQHVDGLFVAMRVEDQRFGGLEAGDVLIGINFKPALPGLDAQGLREFLTQELATKQDDGELGATFNVLRPTDARFHAWLGRQCDLLADAEVEATRDAKRAARRKARRDAALAEAAANASCWAPSDWFSCEAAPDPAPTDKPKKARRRTRAVLAAGDQPPPPPRVMLVP
ncbi:hypothetical protein M885DRAFT_510790 [Pelagophyceae sp. CCMP2097]|nr:hypothetical protein M885DRAFT_510790 [Pelagophyceae sp. CCMP2097]